MLRKVTVDGKGHGLGYNSYPQKIVFFVSEETSEDDIRSKALYQLRRASACDSVTISSIEVGEPITYDQAY